jgi:hypothetical protein
MDTKDTLNAKAADNDIGDYVGRKMRELGPNAIIYGLIHNATALILLAYAGQRGKARDRMSEMIDAAFDEVEEPMLLAIKNTPAIMEVLRKGGYDSSVEYEKLKSEIVTALPSILGTDTVK